MAMMPELLRVEELIDQLWQWLLAVERRSSAHYSDADDDDSTAGRIGIAYSTYRRLHRRLNMSLGTESSGPAIFSASARNDDQTLAEIATDDNSEQVDGYQSDDDEAIWEDWKADCQRKMPGETVMQQVARKVLAKAEKDAREESAAAARHKATRTKAMFRA
eukprot:SAG31_NODE_7022_length_1814_cov_1.567172_1_plen_161_part_10